MRPLLPLLLLLSQPLTQSSAQTGRQGSAPEPFEVELVGSISAPRLTIRSEGIARNRQGAHRALRREWRPVASKCSSMCH